MNETFFVCSQCKVFIDPGQRWAYWGLEEPGIVKRGAPIARDAVLSTKEFWNPPPDKEFQWLREEVFPELRRFLDEHADHEMSYESDDDLFPDQHDRYIYWMKVGYGAEAHLSPRYLVERTGLTRWEEVEEILNGRTHRPFWFLAEFGEYLPIAKTIFENAVKQREMTVTTSFHINPDTLDFDLPERLIAQEPVATRDQARLLVLNRAMGTIEHRHFADVGDYLRPGDVLVLNNARVDRAKLVGQKDSGGRFEAILLGPNADGTWRALVRPVVKPGTRFRLGSAGTGLVLTREASGEYRLRFDGVDVAALMESEGRLPLPPYIKRAASDPRDEMDAELYQTVYAARPGSVAAPTAGLHFTPALLNRLTARGIKRVEILLNVGWGTFRPIANTVAEHRMMSEHYEVSAAALRELNAAQKEGRRIVAVGTTATRVLESLPPDIPEKDRAGKTDLFIRPGFHFHRVGALITNFHVPRSTPVSLTAAFCGLPLLERAYDEAIERDYRFFSYGDAMLVI